MSVKTEGTARQLCGVVSDLISSGLEDEEIIKYLIDERCFYMITLGELVAVIRLLLMEGDFTDERKHRNHS